MNFDVNVVDEATIVLVDHDQLLYYDRRVVHLRIIKH